MNNCRVGLMAGIPNKQEDLNREGVKDIVVVKNFW
jgi:hypothetical protein